MAIYSIIPDFGVSNIIFTIVLRLLLWPLIEGNCIKQEQCVKCSRVGEDQKAVREESTNA